MNLKLNAFVEIYTFENQGEKFKNIEGCIQICKKSTFLFPFMIYTQFISF